MAYESKEEYTELTPGEVRENIRVCDHNSCLNNYTPYKSPEGERFCLTHGKK